MTRAFAPHETGSFADGSGRPDAADAATPLPPSSRQLAEMFEAMPDAVVAVDATGVIRMANAQAERLFGYAAGALAGLPLECLVPEHLRHRHAEHRGQFQAAPHVRRMGDAGRRLTARRQDGSLVPVDIGLGTVCASGARWTVAFVRDQTNTQALVDELSRARGELEQELELRRQLRSLSELLQLPASREAIRPVLSLHLEHLFPATRGALLMHDEERQRVECLADWRGGADDPGAFDAAGCVAIRSGLAAGGADTAEAAGRCERCFGPHGASRCAPLVASGRTLGVLAVHPLEAGVLAEAERRTIDAVADWLGLPVANLRLREQLQDLTYRDPLTGLHNRRYLDDVLTRELAGARRRGTPLGVAVVDLDHFKTLNDTFGHGAGDDVLRAFAGVLGRRFRASDAVCRYGGEEFVVVCSGCAGADLARALDAVREQWAALPLASGPCSTLSSTFSAGVAEFPGDGLDGVQLLRAADAALYAAKGAGRNRVVLGPGSHTAPPARGSDPESGHGPDPPRSGASRM